MGIHRIEAGYPAWKEMQNNQKTRKNRSEEQFGYRMAGIAATVDSESAKKANVICKRDHYVGGNMANIYINEMPLQGGLVLNHDPNGNIPFDGKTDKEWEIEISDAAPINHFAKSDKANAATEGYNELNRADQESETETNIIVKPDGSRVLVVTMNIGGMETTMSLEISKPTHTLNETANQEVRADKQSAVSDGNLSENQVAGTSM